MAYTNELVSSEDIQLYRLDDWLAQFHPWAWREGRPDGFVHAWTVDRERNIFFLHAATVEETGPSGRPEPTNKVVWLACFGGAAVTATLERTKCPKSFAEVPFVIGWQLQTLDIPSTLGIPRDAVISEIEAALSVYGYEGAHHQVPNTVVEFSIYEAFSENT